MPHPRRPLSSVARRGVPLAIVLLAASAGEAHAQGRRPAPAAAPTPPPPSGPAAQPSAPDLPPPPSAELLAPTPGGLTAEQAAERATRTSFAVRAAEETEEAADARVDAAKVGYLPVVTTKASYTRLSPLTNPPLFPAGPPFTVATNAPVGSENPATFVPPQVSFEFPVILDNYLLSAAVVVPLSDYVFRIAQGVASANRAKEAAQFDVSAAKAKAGSDARLFYYAWLRARGAVIVAEQALAAAKSRKRDAEAQFTVGNASKADTLNAETGVSSAELLVVRAKNAALVAERQLRIAMHVKPDETIEPGEGLEATLPPVKAEPAALLAEAESRRPELKSLGLGAESARKGATATRNQRLPSISAFGQLDYANPNQRRFPIEEVWFPTWSVGVQATWSPNSILQGGAAGAELDAKAAALEEQRRLALDGVALEVTQAHQSVLEADVAIETTNRQITSATEAHRVARELFANGRATATQLTEAETNLTRTRIEYVNARVDARMARIRLDHALGRDVKDR